MQERFVVLVLHQCTVFFLCMFVFFRFPLSAVEPGLISC